MGWLLSSACLLSLLYGLYEAELTPVTAAAYSSLSHSAWALGLAWIVIACSTGYGGEKYIDCSVNYNKRWTNRSGRIGILNRYCFRIRE